MALITINRSGIPPTPEQQEGKFWRTAFIIVAFFLLLFSQVQNQFPTLYRNERFAEFNPGIEGVGNNFFNNCTRQQVKDTSTNCAQ